MALWFLFEKAPCYQYPLYDGTNAGSIYNQWLIKSPRQYTESLYNIPHFFFVPGEDKLVAFAWLSITYWPGWAFRRLEWDANTGEFIKQVSANFWGATYASAAVPGTDGRIFTAKKTTTGIYEVYWDTLANISLIFTPPKLASHAVVNLIDDLAACISGWNIFIYQNITTTPAQRASFRLPNTLGYLAYENRNNLWISTKDGLVLKMHYRRNPPRWALLTSVQDPPADATNFMIAFDSKRNRLAILIVRPDAEDGACRTEIEFYRPIVKVAEDGLTTPACIGPRKRGGETINFISHVIGEQGDGLAGVVVQASLVDPIEGTLLTKAATTLVNGAVRVAYQAPPLGGNEETLQLSAELTENE